jgi:hypothetical protein
MSSLERKIGSRAIFAIEFSVEPILGKPVNEWWGKIQLWVGGRCVGNPEEVEMVSIGLGTLDAIGKQTGSRGNPLLGSLPVDTAIDNVMQAIYGETGAETEQFSSEDLSKFEVFPVSIPFFDNWEAILLEEGDEERFLYRREGEPGQVVTWDIGTFREITSRANFELTLLQGPSNLIRGTVQ